MPSHGREVAHGVRSSKATRHVPIVFVGGEAEKVERTRQLLPDAVYTTWGRIKTALPKAIARPPKAPVIPDHNAAWGKPTVGKAGRQAWIQDRAARLAEGLRRCAPAVAGEGHASRRKPDPQVDLFLCFARSSRELHAHLLALKAADRQTAWLIWPKKASGVKSDLDGNIVRTTGLAAGWVDFKVCSRHRHLVRPRLQAPQVAVGAWHQRRPGANGD